jgi:MraZ protein
MSETAPDISISGRADHQPDDKNRLIMPIKFRPLLDKHFVMTMGPNHSIRAYPIPVYQQLVALVSSQSPLDELDGSVSLLQRMLFNSEIVEMDNQFRFTIPRFLRDWAGIDDRHAVAIFGCGSRLELWEADKWAAYADKVFTDEAITDANKSRFGGAQPAPSTPAA